MGLRSRWALDGAAALRGLRAWSARRWWAAAVASLGTVLVVAVPTAMIPTPVFGREVPTTPWAWPALVLTAALSGLLAATYVREAAPGTAGLVDRDGDRDVDRDGDRDGDGPVPGRLGSADEAEGRTEGRAGALGGALTFLAVGCPVCNKLALLALGYTGAIQWFAPVQPWLAVGAVGLLGWALVRRLGSQEACTLPAR